MEIELDAAISAGFRLGEAADATRSPILTKDRHTKPDSHQGPPHEARFSPRAATRSAFLAESSRIALSVGRPKALAAVTPKGRSIKAAPPSGDSVLVRVCARYFTTTLQMTVLLPAL